MNMRIKHIDGLRGIAVISVILFHAFPEQFPNGFLGVDIFFVISGFAITLSCIKRYQKGLFTIQGFFGRRIIRIYPPLFVCVFLSSIFALFLFQPEHLENFFQSSFAALIGANNILLYLTGGYWTLDNHFKPLFHTWSLGIEEQFYFIYPLIFTIFISSVKHLKLNELKIKLSLVLLLLFSTSFFLSVFWYYTEFPGNYLLPFSRVWEFILGVTAALCIIDQNNPCKQVFSNVSFIVLLIFLSGLIPINATFAPSPLMLLPLAATACICMSKVGKFPRFILENSFIVYLGLASYSIYLYHQPILAFGRVISEYELSGKYYVFLITLSVFAGIASYELIEKRFTYFYAKVHKKIAYLVIVISGISFALFSLYASRQGGWYELRFPHLLINGKPQEGIQGGSDYVDRSRKLYGYIPFQGTKTKVAVVGNSQARDFVNIISESGYSSLFEISYLEDVKENLKQSSEILQDADIIISIVDKYELERLTGIKYDSSFLFLRPRPRLGYNVTPIMFIRDDKERRSKFFTLNNKSLKLSTSKKIILKTQNYAWLNLTAYLVTQNGQVPYTDIHGDLISFDTIHLTKSGAQLLAKKLFSDSKFLKFMKGHKTKNSLRVKAVAEEDVNGNTYDTQGLVKK